MKIRARSYLVPFALGAMAFVVFALTGCGRDASPPEKKPPAYTPESYMKDPDFRGRLKEQRAAREELQKARETVVDQMKAKIDAVVKKLGTNDTAAVRAALRADPEWRSLYKRCQEANAALSENRRKTMAIVGQRLTPPQPPAQVAPRAAEKAEKPAGKTPEKIPVKRMSK
jgi:hypothetical protein